MSDRSAIEWTDASWNPLRARLVNIVNGQRVPRIDLETRKQIIGWHCEHVSEGCRNCYAEKINLRLGTQIDYKPGNRDRIECFLDEQTLLQPLHWRKPRKIFVCSMSDLFGDWVTEAQLDRIFAVMALCPQHTFQVLTKRAERMRTYIGSIKPLDKAPWDRITEIAMDIGYQVRGYRGSGGLVARPLPNVWLGISCEDQPTADERLAHLRETPAAVHFASFEPLLGPIGVFPGHMDGLDWIIVGGESGPNARPMHPQWARSLRDQCHVAGVYFFFKQWGEWREPTDQRNPHNLPFVRVGKKRAGRLLDGVEHSAFPEIVR